MSHFLHPHFDAMNKVDGIPTFAIIEYVSRHSYVIIKTILGREYQYYETSIKVIFKTKKDKNVICVYFKNYVVKNNTEI